MSKNFNLSLGSRYTLEEGTIILTGLQALVRLPIDQHKADKRNGLHTGTLISGYRGSPLGGFDTLLHREAQLLKKNHVVFMPGVNEDLAATAILGSQTANLLPSPKYDGVNGIWYGKGPGVDRSGDIFKHAQITGVYHKGGVLAIAGDDPTAKSSTIPSHSEIALYDAQMPILYPGNVQEVIEFGRYGFELSRYSGSWAGYKIVTDVADSYQIAEVAPVSVLQPEFEYLGRPWRHTQNPALLAPHSLAQEKEIHDGRLEAAKAFAAVNKLNKITVRGPDDTLGLVATGKTYYDVKEALYHLGLDDAALQRFGIRLLKIGMMYPLEEGIIQEFAQDLQEIWVIEEKRSFIEWQIRDLLYNRAVRPVVYGKKDADGRRFIRADYELDVDQLTKALGHYLDKRIEFGPLQAKVREMEAPPAAIGLTMQAGTARTPYFCSGCPHNRSTVVPDGSLQGGGIGCHTLAILMDRNITGVTQMGGEGAQWVGAAPFSDTNHIFQNIGDGTLFHSGSMAIRQAVTTDANMTYKILYNGAVAMTGGQHADGEIPIPELTHFLRAEGVVKTVICTYDLDKYPAGTDVAPGTEIWDRDRLDEAQKLLREVDGITALIYDQPCATELRRQRKRGQVADPNKRIFINEAICEGCGDCGVKSNCLSVFPVDTEFGRKTQIHQSSCNKDYTCLDGNCPAFVTVELPDGHQARKVVPTVLNDQKDRLTDLPEPTVPDGGNVFMMGIGGTGVVTINQILATAALMDGRYVNSLDQTGLSQKGGPVVSHLKIRPAFQEMASKIGAGTADAYLVFDLLTGTTEKSLELASKNRSVAVVSSSKIPTGAMVKTKEIKYPEGEMLQRRLEMNTRAADNVYLDAIEIAENLFGSHMPANILTIGAAYQAGIMPISAEAIEAAIKLNGVAVPMNLDAFRVGRLIVADPSWLPSLELHRLGAQPITTELLTQEGEALLNSTGATGELRRLMSLRISELMAYQNLAYAKTYVDFVKQVMAAEDGVGETGDGRLSQAVARYLFKLMAYKDEYEVARLSLKPAFQNAVTEQFGSEGVMRYMLHPPFLKALGVKKKIGFGRWFNAGFRVLTALKGLRGTRWDFFGYDEVRQEERRLIEEYRALVTTAVGRLATGDVEAYDRAVQLAELPDVIRGYDEVKLANIGRYREQVASWQETGSAVAAD